MIKRIFNISTASVLAALLALGFYNGWWIEASSPKSAGHWKFFAVLAIKPNERLGGMPTYRARESLSFDSFSFDSRADCMRSTEWEFINSARLDFICLNTDTLPEPITLDPHRAEPKP